MRVAVAGRTGARCLARVAAALLALLPLAAGAAPIALNCAPAPRGAVLNEVLSPGGSVAPNLVFVEIKIVQPATRITGWRLCYSSSPNSQSCVNLGTGQGTWRTVTDTAGTADNAGPDPANPTTFSPETWITYAPVNNISSQGAELVILDSAGRAVDYLRYNSQSGACADTNTRWAVPSACGSCVDTRDSSQKDFARIPDGSGNWVDNGDGPTTGASNGGTAPGPLAEWRMEQTSWNGTAGEVRDETGAYPATARNGAATAGATPAIAGNPGTCRYGSLDGSDDHLTVAGFPDLTGSFTITAWIRPDVVDKHQRIFADDEGNTGGYALSLGDGGAGRLRFFSRGLTPVELDSGAVVTAGAWQFVSAVHDAGARRRLLYHNAVAVTAATRYSGTWGTDAGTASIGGETNAAGSEAVPQWRFDGLIDEVRVYGRALSAAEIAQVMAETHPCASAADHYAIGHDGAGVTCLAEPVTVTAHAADHTAATPAAGTVLALSTSSGRGTWSAVLAGGGTLADPTPGDGLASYTFPGGQSAVTLALSYPDVAAGVVESLGIDASEGGRRESSSEDPALAFAAAGFVFRNVSDGSLVLPTQIAGKPSDQGAGAKSLSLQAVRTDTQTGSCLPLFPAGADVSVELGSVCVDPGTCLAGQRVRLTSNGLGHDLANPQNLQGGSAYAPVTLRFGADAVAPFSLRYTDAGSIRLRARHPLTLPDGTATGLYMGGGSNAFVVRPFGLDLDFADDRAVNGTGGVSYAADVGGTVFGRAGRPFATTLTAVAWQAADDGDADGQPDAGAVLGDNPATPSFGRESAAPAVSVSRVLVDPPPASGNPGTLTGGAAVSGFAAGVATVDLAWDEVGIIDLTAALAGGSYLGGGQGIVGRVRNVGRFTPDHLDVAVAGAPLLSPGCAGFTYLGQPFNYLAGAQPRITITARNAGGQTTRNYADHRAGGGSNWWRLPDLVPAYADAGVLPAGVGLDAAASGHTPATDAATAPGQVTTTLHGPLAYTRPATGDAAPFSADLWVRLAVVDADGIGYDDGAGGNLYTLVLPFDGGAAGVRHGRLRASSAAGSELLPLAVPLLAEYFNGTAFVTSAADGCTALDPASQLRLSNPATGGGAPQPGTTAMAIGAGSTTAALAPVFAAGDGGLAFAPPGAGNTGHVDLDLALGAAGAPYWLQYNWSGTAPGHAENPPRVRATFGIYRGSPYLIQIREPWN